MSRRATLRAVAARAAPAARARSPRPRNADAERPPTFTSTVLSSADGPGVAVPMEWTIDDGAGDRVGRGTSRPHGERSAARFRCRSREAAARASARWRRLERNYPQKPAGAGVSGSATLRVQIMPDGPWAPCARLSETYPGFGEAASARSESGLWGASLDRQGRPAATEITYACRFEVRG